MSIQELKDFILMPFFKEGKEFYYNPKTSESAKVLSRTADKLVLKIWSYHLGGRNEIVTIRREDVQ